MKFLFKLLFLFTPSFLYADQPKDWQLGFQKSASSTMSDIVIFHDYITLNERVRDIIISNDRNREEGIFYVSLSVDEDSESSRFNPFGFLRRNPSQQIADPEYMILVTRSGDKTLIKAESVTDNVDDVEDLISILNESLS